MELFIASTWDGHGIAPSEQVLVTLTFEDGLRIEVDAPFHGDPPPPGDPGPTPRLWEHEVVEVFVLGDDEHYTEIELSPHGHHLVLRLEGVRNATESGLDLDFAATIEGNRWTGTAQVPADYLPAGALRVNAFAIHGDRYLCWSPTLGDKPDFHRLESFVVVD